MGCIMPYFAIVLSVLGIVFGVMQNRRGHTGIGTAGLVIGIVGCALNAVMLFLVAIILAVAGF